MRAPKAVLLIALFAACAAAQRPSPSLPNAPATSAPSAPTQGSAPQARPLSATRPLDLVVLRDPQKPIVTFRLVFRSGSIDDPAGKEGLTALTTELMESGGTEKLSSSQLLEALFPMAAELSTQVDKELTLFSGRVHQDYLEPFLDIFLDVLVAPRLDPKELTRLKADALNGITTGLRSESDEELGKVALDRALFARHPYAHYVGGTVQGLTAITLEDVKAQRARVFTQDRLLIGLAGPVDGKLEERVRARLARLPAKGAAPTPVPAPLSAAGKVLILKKDALSTAISLGMVNPVRRGDADFFPLSLAVSALGEHRQFGGVLFKELRERRGLNYGDYAYAEHFEQEGAGTFARLNLARQVQDLSLWLRPVEPANALFATRAALHYLRALAQNGLSHEEFERSRQFLEGYTRLWDQTDARRLGYAIDARLYGTPPLPEAFRAALDTMTPADVKRAVRNRLHPEQLSFVFVAKDAEGLAAALLSGAPSPMRYPSPKPPEVLETDKVIMSTQLPVDPRHISVESAQTFMER